MNVRDYQQKNGGLLSNGYRVFVLQELHGIMVVQHYVYLMPLNCTLKIVEGKFFVYFNTIKKMKNMHQKNILKCENLCS